MASTNLNTEVLAALHELADTLARLNEHGSPQPAPHADAGDAIADLTQEAAKLSLSTGSQQVPISHYRTQPPALIEAYEHLSTACQYIHATSTKYTLVSKIDYEKEGGNLAVELRKGAELLAASTLTAFDPQTGCGPSVKRYIKQFTRGVIASIISLITSFEDGSALTGGKENQIGPQKTGAVWSACEQYQQLPRGNRNAMRRECMIWVRDCMDSIAEFEEIMALGEREEDDGDDENEETMEEEERYTAREMKVVKASVNVMKCTKNVLGLVLKACDCVGDVVEKANNNADQNATKELLQWINVLHELARKIGEGVTDFGILLYPPLDLKNEVPGANLGIQLKNQLQSLEQCVSSIDDCSVENYMSDEVKEAVEKLKNGVKARSEEVESAMS